MYGLYLIGAVDRCVSVESESTVQQSNKATKLLLLHIGKRVVLCTVRDTALLFTLHGGERVASSQQNKRLLFDDWCF